jgi:hypothetical protein
MDLAFPSTTHSITQSVYVNPATLPVLAPGIMMERFSDGKFYKGGGVWDTPTTTDWLDYFLDMTAMTLNIHHPAETRMYEYLLPLTATPDVYEWSVYEYLLPLTATPDVYEWSVTYAVRDYSTGQTTLFKRRGRISTDWSHFLESITELAAEVGGTATPLAVVSLVNLILRNKITVTGNGGEWTICDDAGTPLIKATLSDDATTFTRGELVNA